MKTVVTYINKSKNKRVCINAIIEDETLYFSITVKRLIDFRKREILKYNMLLSAETFMILTSMMIEVNNDPDLLEYFKQVFEESKNER